jgi:spoIIIJ-associated protein
LGAEEAQVRLTPKRQAVAGRESSPQVDVSPPEPFTATDLGDEIKAAKTDVPDEAPVLAESQISDKKEVEEIARRYLSGLLERMGIEARVTTRLASDLVEEGEEPPLALNITGPDLGILIGRRSETLQALQYMLRLMVSKQMSSWQPIVVDVESYRVRRRRSLHRMAEKMAERAVSSRKRVVLEAMPAYERRVIHVALKDHPNVITKSIGSDENRKVTIIPK